MDTSPRKDGTDYAILIGSDPGSSSTAAHTPDSAHKEESLVLLPESTLGGIQVVRLIGCGKVSESWFGVDASQQREVVIKVLRKPWCTEGQILSYFERQLRAIGDLRHPNLANIIDVGIEDGTLYWITEWVKGGSVGPKVRRKGPMDISTALNVIDQAAAGLAHGASARLVHGGLKPENILMERTHTVKVSDLGVEFSARQLVSGTPAASALWVAEYMAPEVRSGAIPDVRSDVYSLGAILLYLIAGVVPHDGMLDATSPRVTPALRELLINMTAPKPEDRLPDYGELRAAIADADAGNTGIRKAPVPSNWLMDSNVSNVTPVNLVDTVIMQKPDDTQPVMESDEIAAIALPAHTASETTPHDGTPAVPVVEKVAPPSAVALASATELPNLPGPTHPTPAALRLKTPPAGLVGAAPRRSSAKLIATVGLVAVAAAGAGGWYYMQKHKQDTAKASPEAVVVAPTSKTAAAQPLVKDAGPATPAKPAAPQPGESDAMVKLPPPPPVAQTAAPKVVVAAAPPVDVTALPPGVDASANKVRGAATSSMPVISNAAPVPPPTSAGAAAAPGGPIIVDNAASGALQLDPPAGWRASSEARASYAGGSLVAQAGGVPAKATFFADVPRDGRYQLYMWWVSRSSDVRSATVPVTVMSAGGPINLTIDQVNSESDFNLVGTYQLKAGAHQPVVTVSTEGVKNESGNVHVSVDALKLVPLGN